MLKLDQNEKVILEERKHWFVIFVDGLMLFIVAIIPPIIFAILFKLLPQLKEINLGGDEIYFLAFLYSIWLLGVWTIFFVRWTDYYLDVWYITPKRIIAINQKGLFWREVIDLRYEKIQDVTSEINGVIQTLLNFGDLHIQTAGTNRDIILKQARNPLETKKIILAHHSKVVEKTGEDL